MAVCRYGLTIIIWANRQRNVGGFYLLWLIPDRTNPIIPMKINAREQKSPNVKYMGNHLLSRRMVKPPRNPFRTSISPPRENVKYFQFICNEKSRNWRLCS